LLDYLAAAEDRLVRRRARLLRQLDGHRKQHLLNSENPGQVVDNPLVNATFEQTGEPGNPTSGLPLFSKPWNP
jgi:hypothetical protein